MGCGVSPGITAFLHAHGLCCRELEARLKFVVLRPRSLNSFQSHNPKNAPTFTNYSKNTTERSINCTGSGYTELNVILTYSKIRTDRGERQKQRPGEEGRSISRTQLDSRRNAALLLGL